MWLPPEFQSLSTEQKAKFVWQHGTYLMIRCKNRYAITLHALDGRFVEIWLDTIQKRVSMLFTFRHTGQLEPYLEKLALPQELQQYNNKTVE